MELQKEREKLVDNIDEQDKELCDKNTSLQLIQESYRIIIKLDEALHTEILSHTDN